MVYARLAMDLGGDKQAGEFDCATCGGRYRWKGELAGRKVKCRCGAVMVCPAEPVDFTYDVAERAVPSEKAKAAPATVVVPAAAAAIAPASRVVGYREVETLDPQANVLFRDRTIDLSVPLALLAGGVLVEFGAAVIRSWNSPFPFRYALVGIGARLTIEPLVMMVGILIAAKFRGISFGHFGVAAMKLAAIAIAPGAVGTLLGPVAGAIPIVGGLGVLIVEFVLYFALIGTLFNLDQEDTWYCVCVSLF